MALGRELRLGGIDIKPILSFLGSQTPESWLVAAAGNIDELLIDHANCEKKAASTALNLIYRYVDKPDLLHRMSRLAREELRHFEQVVSLMQRRKIEYVQMTASRYAAGMRAPVRTHEPARLVDTLIAGAFIEARSCERFYSLIPFIDNELGVFYQSLLKSESRHFKDYLRLARRYSEGPIEDRVEVFRGVEQELIASPDAELRFHSGVPGKVA